MAPPNAVRHHDDETKEYGDADVAAISNGANSNAPLMDLVSAEIERMRAANKEHEVIYHTFPPACLRLLHSLDGNTRCVDCGNHNPQWAAVSYGALLCLQCSGRHRSLGVQVSCVRSIRMDEWSLEQVLTMLEGGNSQLDGFFSRHALTEESCPEQTKLSITKVNVTRLRYKTKAALFYRNQMTLHVSRILQNGPYRGREISRATSSSSSSRHKKRGRSRDNAAVVVSGVEDHQQQQQQQQHRISSTTTVE